MTDLELSDFAKLVQAVTEKFHSEMPLVRPIDNLIQENLLGADPALEAALATNRKAGLVPFDVAPNQGKLLELLVRGTGGLRALEIGTLGGYSTISLARGVGPGGQVVTIEQNPRCAEVAMLNLQHAGLADRVEIRTGAALDVLSSIQEGLIEHFDFVFIDADKENDVAYVQWAIRLCRPGAMIVVDNVIRFGGVLDPDHASVDPGARGSRDLLEFLSSAEGIDSTAVQTVGEKGWDGFVLGIVAARE